MATPLVLLRNAHLFDPDDVGYCDVLCAGGQVAAIADGLDLPPAHWPCEVVDLGGARVIPGLVDTHVHLCGGGGEAGAHTRVPRVEVPHLTLAGVTTAVGLLGTDGTTRTVAESLACARAIAHAGLTTYCYTGSYELPLQTLTGSVRGDLVHNDRLIAVGELALSDHRSSQPTYEELLRIASDCHVCGLMTGKAGLLHLHLGDGPRGLALVRRALHESELPARTFHPTHVNRNRALWAETKQVHAERGLYADVTAFEADADSLDAADAIGDWLDSGLDPARLTASSDGGGCLPVFDGEGVVVRMEVGRSMGLSDALVKLLAQGRPLAAVLPVFTRNPARLFRLRGKGNLSVGSDADLAVLDETGRARDVLAKGRWMVRDGRAIVYGPFDRPAP
ncbi:MAG: beta-aspartyl-peptidase [Deltaproteobacteria bacterium]|nr:beta-aspartyl-peptidase [Deltaproteobacteria bacterium]